MPLTKEQREKIVATAMSWIGTPYRGWTCQKKVGCDCGQLLKGVFLECGFGFQDGIQTPENYPLWLTQHKKSTQYEEIVSRYMREIPESEAQPGDIVLFKIGLGFAHAAIIKSYPDFVIHALSKYGVVGGHATANSKFGRLKRKFYTLKDEFCQEPVGSPPVFQEEEKK